MPSAQILNACGLAIGLIAALLMYFCPPTLKAYAEDGALITGFVDRPSARGLRINTVRSACSKLAPLLLGASFLLQLTALYHA